MDETDIWISRLIIFPPATREHAEQLVAMFTEEDKNDIRSDPAWGLARAVTRIQRDLPKDSILLFMAST